MKRFLIILSILAFFVKIAHAQCPHNEVNCSYGCWRHHDEDGDGYCDFSILEGSALQANIEAKNKALNEKNEAEEEKVKEKESSINDEKNCHKRDRN
jgi:Skp family chaperone for outer membrane proteins